MIRSRMQNHLSMNFGNDWTLTQTNACVKRLRLNFDGYIFLPESCLFDPTGIYGVRFS